LSLEISFDKGYKFCQNKAVELEAAIKNGLRFLLLFLKRFYKQIFKFCVKDYLINRHTSLQKLFVFSNKAYGLT